MWLASEEESFGRTLEQGLAVLARADRARARRAAASVSGADAFRLHDTFGFPIELTRELVAEQGLAVDEGGFEALMDDQRTAQPGGRRRRGRPGRRARATPSAFAGRRASRRASSATRRPSRRRRSARSSAGDGRVLVKLADSPFYAAGGGQVSDVGVIECADGDCRARVADVVRLGDDQALVRGARGGRAARRASACIARVDRADAPRDRVQPHRHAPAARGAARAARHPRAPGGLLRRPRQAALRLQPRRRR